MSTEAQIVANRRNSTKSTGPQTVEGKATVAKNAIKHGLFAQENVVISENQADFDLLRDEMLGELAPDGVMESMLAERIVSLTWRLKRAERMQNEAIDVKIRNEINKTFPNLTKSLLTGEPQQSPDKYDDLALGYIAVRDFPELRVLERLSMYERRIELSLYKTMAELQKLRQSRKAEEARIDDETATQSQLDKKVKMKKQFIPKRSQNRPDLSTPLRFAQDDKEKKRLKKQFIPKGSQSAEAEYELSAFEKKEYELLTSSAPGKNNLSPREAKQTQCISY